MGSEVTPPSSNHVITCQILISKSSHKKRIRYIRDVPPRDSRSPQSQTHPRRTQSTGTMDGGWGDEVEGLPDAFGEMNLEDASLSPRLSMSPIQSGVAVGSGERGAGEEEDLVEGENRRAGARARASAPGSPYGKGGGGNGGGGAAAEAAEAGGPGFELRQRHSHNAESFTLQHQQQRHSSPGRPKSNRRSAAATPTGYGALRGERSDSSLGRSQVGLYTCSNTVAP
jgi:hypothetical protein